MEKPRKTRKKNTEKKTSKNEEQELNLISSKLKEEKEKNKSLKEENEQLLKDIIIIKTNIKSLIPCLPQNRLYPFPSLEELVIHIQNFINNICVKFYNRLLKKNQFPFEVIIIHFKSILTKCQELINNHFSSVDTVLNSKFQNMELIKPLNSIIENAYQINWKNIYNKLTTEDKVNSLIEEIKQNIYEKAKQNPSYIIGYSSSFTSYLKEFIKNSIEIFLKCYINQPKININLTKIGKMEQYNSLSNECLLDENIVRGDECFIILPSFHYINEKNKKKEIINKDKIVKSKEKIINSVNLNLNSFNETNISDNAIFKNTSKSNIINSTKSTNYFFNNKIYNNRSNNIRMNYRDKKINYGNESHDRKKYSEIYSNSKSYANRNINYYCNINTNNNISYNNNYNVKKINCNRNHRRYNKNDSKEYDNNQKKRKNYIYFTDDEKD